MYSIYKIYLPSDPGDDKNGKIQYKKTVADRLRSILAEDGDGPVFVIGSWQSGDFCHIYAAAVRHLSVSPSIPFAMLVLVDGNFPESLFKDVRFAMEQLFSTQGGRFCLFYTDKIRRTMAIEAMQAIKSEDNAREPYNATFWAEEAVKKMTKGQPLTPVWADLVRDGDQGYSKFYNEICMSFMTEYVEKFGMSVGREKFICLWGRTSGAPSPTQVLGGANPQYDSSMEGNNQLCHALHSIPSVKAIFIVGGGFDTDLNQLPFVFNLGDFWRRQSGIRGRFQENGFFDYMTAFYDCDVVHVGMKSGGMDALGLWGQKVVFIDSLRAPDITKGRVAAWSTNSILPVEISEMPTSMGKAIEEERDEARGQNKKGFKTTFEDDKQLKKMVARAASKDEGFNVADLTKITTAVASMFG